MSLIPLRLSQGCPCGSCKAVWLQQAMQNMMPSSSQVEVLGSTAPV